MKKIAFLLAATIVLTGCMSVGVEVKQDQLAEFKKGVTMEPDVVARLGKPTSRIIDSEGGAMLMYTYIHSQARPAAFIPIVGALVGGADSESTMTTFRFDSSGKLLSYTSSQSQYGSGTGFASGRPTAETDQPRQSNN